MSQTIALREVQAAGLQHRRVVAEVGVTAPDVERPPRHQHAGHVAEPGVRAAGRTPRRETKSFASGRSLARSFLLRRLRLPRVPRQVEPLVVRAGEGTQPRGDGVVRARLDLHVVGRVGVDQVDGLRRRAAGPRPRACCCRRRGDGDRPAGSDRPAWSSPRRVALGHRQDRSTQQCRPVRVVRPACLGRIRGATGRDSRLAGPRVPGAAA